MQKVVVSLVAEPCKRGSFNHHFIAAFCDDPARPAHYGSYIVYDTHDEAIVAGPFADGRDARQKAEELNGELFIQEQMAAEKAARDQSISPEARRLGFGVGR